MFGRLGRQARECWTARQHFLAGGAALWRVVTLKGSLGAAQPSTTFSSGALYRVRRTAKPERYDIHIRNDRTTMTEMTEMTERICTSTRNTRRI